MAEPWERQESESSKAFAAFCFYRDLGIERTIEKAYQASDPRFASASRASGRWSAWSIEWNWVERAAAWDGEQDRLRRAKWVKEREKMDERHASLAMAMQGKVIERLRSITPSDLSVGDLARWMAEAVKIERLARGEATEKVKQEISGPGGGPIRTQAGPDLSKLSVDDLEKLDEILSKAEE